MTPAPMPDQRTPRQTWMAILARTSGDELAALIERHPHGPYDILKPAETGTVMVESRAGGTGGRFNLGEATVTRCAIRLQDGTFGFSYALGRDRRKAEMAALIDAMLQKESPGLAGEVEALGEAQRLMRENVSRKAAATKVDFFTMVRGE